MTYTQTISIEADVFVTDEFHDLKKTRKLSKLVNALLRSHLSIKQKDQPGESKEHINLQLQDIAAKRALLTSKLDEIEKEEQKEKDRYDVIQ